MGITSYFFLFRLFYYLFLVRLIFLFILVPYCFDESCLSYKAYIRPRLEIILVVQLI